MGSHDPEEPVLSTQAFDIHLALGSAWQIDKCVEREVPVVTEAAVLHAPQAFDAGGLVTGEKEAVTHPGNCGEILVKRIL